MLIKVNGIHIDIGDALREHVETHLQAGIKKYSENPIDATVTFSPDRHEFKCECSTHISTGLNAQASGRAGDIYASFDQALERIEKQLRRYKRRLKDHHKDRPSSIERIEAAAFIIESEPEDADEPETLQPVIIAETSAAIPTLSVGDAVMHMELGGENVLVFQNQQNGTLNVVHRREDGNIGWIDPTPVNRAS